VQGIPGLNDDRIFGKRQPFSPADSSEAAASNDSKEGEPPLLLFSYGLMPVGFEWTTCAMISRLWVDLTCHGCNQFGEWGNFGREDQGQTSMKDIFFEKSLYFRNRSGFRLPGGL
jgi:hypothetical protein